MKKRLFIAIPNTLKVLEKLKQESKSKIRWTTPENLHLTVYFCGDVEESAISAMNTKLEQVVSKINSFELELEKITFAPQNGRERMIWAQFKENTNYNNLVSIVYEAIKDHLGPKFAYKPNKKPIPHVTIARFNDPGITKEIELKNIESVPFRADTLILMESQLSSVGSKYTALQKYKFQ